MSTNLTAAVFYLAQALPQPYGEHEPPDARQYRLSELAVAIDRGSDGDPERAAALLTIAHSETLLSRRVHMMGPRKDRKGWAISLFSLHVTQLVKYDEWITLGGLEGTQDSAIAADRVLVWARQRCGSITGMYAIYATGRSCKWSGARNRVWLHKRLLKTLEEAE